MVTQLSRNSCEATLSSVIKHCILYEVLPNTKGSDIIIRCKSQHLRPAASCAYMLLGASEHTPAKQKKYYAELVRQHSLNYVSEDAQLAPTGLY